MTSAMTLTVIPWRSVSATTIKTIKIRHGQPDVDDAAQDAVDPAAIIGRDKGERRSDRRHRESPAIRPMRRVSNVPLVMTANRLRPCRSLPKGSAQDGGCSTRAESGRRFADRQAARRSPRRRSCQTARRAQRKSDLLRREIAVTARIAPELTPWLGCATRGPRQLQGRAHVIRFRETMRGSRSG